MSELIKKHKILPFLNSGTESAPVWVQVKKATDFERVMNPVTEERDYISEQHPTTEVTDYKPSVALTITTYKGEKDFDLFYDLYKNRAIGSDAQKEFLMVYLFDSVTITDAETSTTTTYYYAEKSNATVVVDSLNSSSSTIGVTVYENGTPSIGYVTITDGTPTFTEGDMPSAA